MLIYLIMGLLAAVLMFIGDMLLYYDKKDYVSNGTFDTVIDIMKDVSDKRLYCGGLIGPIAAFMYCVGYVHIFEIASECNHIVTIICFLVCCLAIIIGGAYHTHCSYLGLVGKINDTKSMDTIIRYFSTINFISMVFQVIGLLMLAILIGGGFTTLPQWMVFFTPGILYLLLPLWKRLPKGIHIIICGGWANLIFVIYYIALIVRCFV